MAKIGRKKILKFMSQFQIVRPGLYNVPWLIVDMALSEVLSGVKPKVLNDFELIQSAAWDGVDTDYYSTIKDSERIIQLIDGCEKLLDALSGDELQRARAHAEWSIVTWKRLASYEQRRKRASRHTQKKDIREAVFERDNNQCVLCSSDIGLTVDHIISVKSGGESHIDNYQTLCRSCNSSKGHR